MKSIQEISNGWVSPGRHSNIPHVICLADFDTNHPNKNRIDRIASEISEYVKWENKHLNKREGE